MFRRSIFFLLFLSSSSVFGQAPNRVELRNIAIQEGHIDAQTGQTGIFVSADAWFNWCEESLFDRSYTLRWKLKDESGGTRYDSRDATERDFRDEAVRPFCRGTIMDDKELEIFIPYRDLNLEEGIYNHSLTFSLTSKKLDLKDFASIPLPFKFTPPKKISFEEQEFKVQFISLNPDASAFGVSDKGIAVNVIIHTTYGPDSDSNEDYQFTWAWKDQNGELLFDSRDARSIFHDEKEVSLASMFSKNGANITVFTSFQELEIEGDQNLTFLLNVGRDEEESVNVFEWKGEVKLPKRYSFNEQQFNVTSSGGSQGRNLGVSAFRYSGTCSFEETGPRADPDKGAYYFYLLLKDDLGNVVFDPGAANLYADYDSPFHERAYPNAENPSTDIDFLIPASRISLPKGNYDLKWELKVTDEQGIEIFPTLEQGTIKWDQPESLKGKFILKSLILESGNYDVEFSIFGNKNPDLIWSISSGSVIQYKSPEVRNSLEAFPGSTDVTYCQGDSLRFSIVDKDRGLFNLDDAIESFYIPGPGLKETLEWNNKVIGNINRLDLELRNK